MTVKTKWLAIGLIGCAAAVAGAVYIVRDLDVLIGSIVPGASISRTTSMTLVSISLRDSRRNGELRLRMPAAYLLRASDRRGGSVETFMAETRLPTLGPLPAFPTARGRPGTPEYEIAMADFNNGISFRMTNSYLDEKGYGARLRENLLARFSVGRDSGKTTAYELVDEDYFGLWRYDQLSCPTATGCRKDDEHYLSKPAATPTVHILCSAQLLSTHDERVACDANTVYRGFQLFYSIPRSQLSRWGEFDSGVRRLLDRFAQDAAQR